ncbi:MAG: hypothetical protein SGARI_000116 [Bacillariaceae sp.]
MFFVLGNVLVSTESFSFIRLTKKQNYGSVGDGQTSPDPLTRPHGHDLTLLHAAPSGDDGATGSVTEDTEQTALIPLEEEQDASQASNEAGTGQRILELAVPALGALLIDPLLTLADTAFVGRFAQSPYELAGMGSATALLTVRKRPSAFVISSLGRCFRANLFSTTPLVASKRSSGKEQEAIAVGGQALSLALALGGILAAALIALRYPLLDLMGISVSGEEATGYAADFLIIRALAAPAVFSISASTGILRGYLDTKTPIFVLLVANVVNFLLDVALIVFAGMGPAGAAIATTTAEWISALLFLFVLAGKLPSADGELGKKDEDTIVVTPSLAIPPWEEVKPLVVASSSVFLRTTVLQLFLSCSAAFAARGTEMEGGPAASIAAHQIAIQLWMLCSYTSDALAAASQGLVADAIGRESPSDVKDVSKTVLVYSSVLGTVLGSILFVGFSTSFLLNLFTSDQSTQADLMDIAALLIFSQPLNSIVFAADGILQGASEFPYQAKSMALSAFVAGSFFWILHSMDISDDLFDVWSALICLQLMRGLTSAYKIVDDDGPIRLLDNKFEEA